LIIISSFDFVFFYLCLVLSSLWYAGIWNQLLIEKFVASWSRAKTPPTLTLLSTGLWSIPNQRVEKLLCALNSDVISRRLISGFTSGIWMSNSQIDFFFPFLRCFAMISLVQLGTKWDNIHVEVYFEKILLCIIVVISLKVHKIAFARGIDGFVIVNWYLFLLNDQQCVTFR
jgi:hypothetical protein